MRDHDFSKPADGTTTFGALYSALRNNFNALRSAFWGPADSAPSGLIAGMLFWRRTSGLDRLKYYDGTDEKDVANGIGEIVTARGSAASLNTRLSVSINADGTLKGDAPVGDWWGTETSDLVRLSNASFSVEGDYSHIYKDKRALEVTSGGGTADYMYCDGDSVLLSGATIVTVSGTLPPVLSNATIKFGQPVNNAPEATETYTPGTVGLDVFESETASAIRTVLELGTAAEADTGSSTGDVVVLEDVGGTPGLPAVDGSQLTGISSSVSLPKNYIAGFVPSNDSGDYDHDLTFTAGECRDASDTVDISLASNWTFKCDTAWASGDGEGKLQSNQSWPETDNDIHVYSIAMASGASPDFLVCVSNGAPGLPPDYVYRRRLLSTKIDTGAIQRFNAAPLAGGGLDIVWKDPELDIDVNTQGTAAISRFINVGRPPYDTGDYEAAEGFVARGVLGVSHSTASSGMVYLRNASASDDEVPSASFAPLAHAFCLVNNVINGGSFIVRTNYSGAITSRGGAANTTLYLSTHAFVDERVH